MCFLQLYPPPSALEHRRRELLGWIRHTIEFTKSKLRELEAPLVEARSPENQLKRHQLVNKIRLFESTYHRFVRLFEGRENMSPQTYAFLHQQLHYYDQFMERALEIHSSGYTPFLMLDEGERSDFFHNTLLHNIHAYCAVRQDGHAWLLAQGKKAFLKAHEENLALMCEREFEIEGRRTTMTAEDITRERRRLTGQAWVNLLPEQKMLWRLIETSLVECRLEQRKAKMSHGLSSSTLQEFCFSYVPVGDTTPQHAIGFEVDMEELVDFILRSRRPEYALPAGEGRRGFHLPGDKDKHYFMNVGACPSCFGVTQGKVYYFWRNQWNPYITAVPLDPDEVDEESDEPGARLRRMLNARMQRHTS